MKNKGGNHVCHFWNYIVCNGLVFGASNLLCQEKSVRPKEMESHSMQCHDLDPGFLDFTAGLEQHRLSRRCRRIVLAW